MAKTLVKTRTGRIVLHLCAACRDLQWSWHMKKVAPYAPLPSVSPIEL